METKNQGATAQLASLEKTLDTYLAGKAPSLPTAWKEVIVSFAPWLTLIFLILSLPIVLAFFGMSAFLFPFAAVAGQGIGYMLAVIVLAVSLVLEGLAIPGLFARSRKGWNLVYYSALLNGVYNLLSMNLGGLVIGTLLSLYILFQVRSYYK